MSNFINKCLKGETLLDDVDDFVEKWHTNKDKRPLYKYLGMSRSEYSLWVADPDVLPYIVTAHKEDRDVGDLLEEINALPAAARSDSPETAVKLMAWLKRKGLWE